MYEVFEEVMYIDVEEVEFVYEEGEEVVGLL